MKKLILFGVCLLLFSFPLTLIRSQAHAETPSELQYRLSFIGEKRLPNTLLFDNTSVGGLSGIDYNPKANDWILVSDDPSTFGPARFYTATLSYTDHAFNSVTLQSVTPLKQPNGAVFPSYKDYAVTHKGVVPNLESIRFDPTDGSVWYTSEGTRAFNFNPFIFHASLKGDYISHFLIPHSFSIRTNPDLGIRKDQGIKGSTFTPSGQFYTILEDPLLQDGPMPDRTGKGFARITKYDRIGHIVGEYVYPISPVPELKTSEEMGSNGVSEILAINDHSFFVLERATLPENDGSLQFSNRLYQIDLNGATNVHPSASLLHRKFTPVSKRLVLDFQSLNLSQVGNLEGMAWGPLLPNGDRSLVFVSDNGFRSKGITQFLAFDVSSGSAR